MKVKDFLAESLVVEVQLRAAFFDFHVRSVFSKSRSATVTQGGATGVLDHVPRKQDTDAFAMMQDEHVNRAKPFSDEMKQCWVWRQVNLKVGTETPVLVRSDDDKFFFFEPHGCLSRFLNSIWPRILQWLP